MENNIKKHSNYQRNSRYENHNRKNRYSSRSLNNTDKKDTVISNFQFNNINCYEQLLSHRNYKNTISKNYNKLLKTKKIDSRNESSSIKVNYCKGFSQAPNYKNIANIRDNSNFNNHSNGHLQINRNKIKGNKRNKNLINANIITCNSNDTDSRVYNNPNSNTNNIDIDRSNYKLNNLKLMKSIMKDKIVFFANKLVKYSHKQFKSICLLSKDLFKKYKQNLLYMKHSYYIKNNRELLKPNISKLKDNKANEYYIMMKNQIHDYNDLYKIISSYLFVLNIVFSLLCCCFLVNTLINILGYSYSNTSNSLCAEESVINDSNLDYIYNEMNYNYYFNDFEATNKKCNKGDIEINYKTSKNMYQYLLRTLSYIISFSNTLCLLDFTCVMLFKLFNSYVGKYVEDFNFRIKEAYQQTYIYRENINYKDEKNKENKSIFRKFKHLFVDFETCKQEFYLFSYIELFKVFFTIILSFFIMSILIFMRGMYFTYSYKTNNDKEGEGNAILLFKEVIFLEIVIFGFLCIMKPFIFGVKLIEKVKFIMKKYPFFLKKYFNNDSYSKEEDKDIKIEENKSIWNSFSNKAELENEYEEDFNNKRNIIRQLSKRFDEDCNIILVHKNDTEKINMINSLNEVNIQIKSKERNEINSTKERHILNNNNSLNSKESSLFRQNNHSNKKIKVKVPYIPEKEFLNDSDITDLSEIENLLLLADTKKKEIIDMYKTINIYCLIVEPIDYYYYLEIKDTVEFPNLIYMFFGYYIENYHIFLFIFTTIQLYILDSITNQGFFGHCIDFLFNLIFNSALFFLYRDSHIIHSKNIVNKIRKKRLKKAICNINPYIRRELFFSYLDAALINIQEKTEQISINKAINQLKVDKKKELKLTQTYDNDNYYNCIDEVPYTNINSINIINNINRNNLSRKKNKQQDIVEINNNIGTKEDTYHENEVLLSNNDNSSKNIGVDSNINTNNQNKNTLIELNKLLTKDIEMPNLKCSSKTNKTKSSFYNKYLNSNLSNNFNKGILLNKNNVYKVSKLAINTPTDETFDYNHINLSNSEANNHTTHKAMLTDIFRLLNYFSSVKDFGHSIFSFSKTKTSKKLIGHSNPHIDFNTPKTETEHKLDNNISEKDYITDIKKYNYNFNGLYSNKYFKELISAISSEKIYDNYENNTLSLLDNSQVNNTNNNESNIISDMKRNQKLLNDECEIKDLNINDNMEDSICGHSNKEYNLLLNSLELDEKINNNIRIIEEIISISTKYNVKAFFKPNINNTNTAQNTINIKKKINSKSHSLNRSQMANRLKTNNTHKTHNDNNTSYFRELKKTNVLQKKNVKALEIMDFLFDEVIRNLDLNKAAHYNNNMDLLINNANISKKYNQNKSISRNKTNMAYSSLHKNLTPNSHNNKSLLDVNKEINCLSINFNKFRENAIKTQITNDRNFTSNSNFHFIDNNSSNNDVVKPKKNSLQNNNSIANMTTIGYDEKVMDKIFNLYSNLIFKIKDSYVKVIFNRLSLSEISNCAIKINGNSIDNNNSNDNFYKNCLLPYITDYLKFTTTTHNNSLDYYNNNFNSIFTLYSISIIDVSYIIYSNFSTETIFDEKQKKLAHTAHEFKTPLNTIVYLSNNIKTKLELHENINEEVENIGSISSYIFYLIADFIQISKNDDSIQVSKQQSNIKHVLDFSYGIMKSLLGCFYDRKLVKTELIIDDFVDKLDVKTDEVRLKQVLLNFLSNSAKFTKEGTLKIICSVVKEKKKINESNNDNDITKLQYKDSTKYAYDDILSSITKATKKKERIYCTNTDLIKINNVMNNLNTSASKIEDTTQMQNTIVHANTNQTTSLEETDVINKVKISYPYIKIIIKDSGSGMNLNQLLEINNNTYNEDLKVDRTNNATGTGLGLNITKKILDALGYPYKIHSRIGEGTETTIYICNDVKIKEEYSHLLLEELKNKQNDNEKKFTGRRNSRNANTIKKQVALVLRKDHNKAKLYNHSHNLNLFPLANKKVLTSKKNYNINLTIHNKSYLMDRNANQLLFNSSVKDRNLRLGCSTDSFQKCLTHKNKVSSLKLAKSNNSIASYTNSNNRNNDIYNINLSNLIYQTINTQRKSIRKETNHTRARRIKKIKEKIISTLNQNLSLTNKSILSNNSIISNNSYLCFKRQANSNNKKSKSHTTALRLRRIKNNKSNNETIVLFENKKLKKLDLTSNNNSNLSNNSKSSFSPYNNISVNSKVKSKFYMTNHDEDNDKSNKSNYDNEYKNRRRKLISKTVKENKTKQFKLINNNILHQSTWKKQNNTSNIFSSSRSFILERNYKSSSLSNMYIEPILSSSLKRKNLSELILDKYMKSSNSKINVSNNNSINNANFTFSHHTLKSQSKKKHNNLTQSNSKNIKENAIVNSHQSQSTVEYIHQSNIYVNPYKFGNLNNEKFDEEKEIVSNNSLNSANMIEKNKQILKKVPYPNQNKTDKDNLIKEIYNASSGEESNRSNKNKNVKINKKQDDYISNSSQVSSDIDLKETVSSKLNPNIDVLFAYLQRKKLEKESNENDDFEINQINRISTKKPSIIMNNLEYKKKASKKNNKVNFSQDCYDMSREKEYDSNVKKNSKDSKFYSVRLESVKSLKKAKSKMNIIHNSVTSLKNSRENSSKTVNIINSFDQTEKKLSKEIEKEIRLIKSSSSVNLTNKVDINDLKALILIVDDVSIIINSLKKNIENILISRNIKDIKVISGIDGLDIISQVIKDNNSLIKLVITDESMQYINGSDAVSFLRNLDEEGKVGHLPYFICTTGYEKNDMKENIFDEIIGKNPSKMIIESILIQLEIIEDDFEANE